MEMYISWDEDKRDLVFDKRRIDFSDLNKLLAQPYIEDQSCEDPEQYRITGLIDGQFVTFIVEYWVDELGELLWVVTAWHSTTQEIEAYEEETK
jgi:uncharacterized DUF497 family protein